MATVRVAGRAGAAALQHVDKGGRHGRGGDGRRAPALSCSRRRRRRVVWIPPPLPSSREERENGRPWRRSDPCWEQETDANAMELLCSSSRSDPSRPAGRQVHAHTPGSQTHHITSGQDQQRHGPEEPTPLLTMPCPLSIPMLVLVCVIGSPPLDLLCLVAVVPPWERLVLAWLLLPTGSLLG